MRTPKADIVDLILAHVEAGPVRMHFGILPDTDLRSRLLQLSKDRLFDFVRSRGGLLAQAAQDTELRFPLRGAPTLYLLNVTGKAEWEQLESQARLLAASGRQGASVFRETIPAVYTGEATCIESQRRKIFEIPILYERRIDYTCADWPSEDYGSPQNVVSLERAFLWLPLSRTRTTEFALLACNDFAAVSKIIGHFADRFSLRMSLPNLSERMLKALAEDGMPRAATFSSVSSRNGLPTFGVRSVTLHDPALKDTAAYESLGKSDDAEQNYGFYVGHKGTDGAGLGITRQYGRIWTPAHLDKQSLLRLGMHVLNSVSRLLDEVQKSASDDFVAFYRNVPVTIGTRRLNADQRQAFEALVQAIIVAADSGGSSETPIKKDWLKYAKVLGLYAFVDYDCPCCGKTVAESCRQCGSPMQAERGSLRVRCPNPRCPQEPLVIEDGDTRECDCGYDISVSSGDSHIRLLPSLDLIAALEDYWRGIQSRLPRFSMFWLRDNEIRLLPTPRSKPKTIRLSDLGKWKTVARIDSIATTDGWKRARSIPRNAKEKCGSTTPKREKCAACSPTADECSAAGVCLLRVFGVPVDEHIDGVHHGHEIADIHYRDVLNKTPVVVGLHVKRHSPSREPLGKRSAMVKGLFTQVAWTIVDALSGGLQPEDVPRILGVAIPNELNDGVTSHIEELVRRNGFDFLAVTKDEWILIAEACMQRLEAE